MRYYLTISHTTVVGYNTHSGLPLDGYVLKGIQFKGVGKDFTTQDIKPTGITACAYDDENWDANTPQVWMRDADGNYSIHLYYLTDGVQTDGGDFIPGWVDGDGFENWDPLVNGTGFWIFDPASEAPSYTFAGEVESETFVQQTYNCADGYTLTSNPFPVAVNPNKDVDWGDLNGVAYDDGDWDTTTPQLWVRDTDGNYSGHYYFLSDGCEDGEGGYVPGWVDIDGFEVESAVIPVGDGFWYFDPKKGTCTATFSMK